MNRWKSHFVYNSRERNGILLLIIIIVILQVVYFTGMFSKPSDPAFFNNKKVIDSLQIKIDSLKEKSIAKKTKKIFPFNPNFLSDYKGYTLGMSTQEIDRLLDHRKLDKWVNSSEEFQNVTGVSDSLLGHLEVYFVFPEFSKNSGKDFFKTEKIQKNIKEKKNLNDAQIEDLEQIKGIGEVLATRIVRYRTKIGNFVDDIQLKDIYGLTYELRNRIGEEYTVKNKDIVQKVDINTASLIQLSQIIYFNYELAREIINYRLLNERINSFEELGKIKDFPSDKIDRIKLYLTID